MLFNYKVLTQEGERKEGSIDALNMDVAISSLQQRGLTIISVEPAKKISFLQKRIPFFGAVPMRDIVLLSRQISTLFVAKVSAVQVFRLLAAETENTLLREKLFEVTNDIRGGSSISQALSKHPSIFSAFYVNMVRAGEESGKLNEIFSYLADHLDRTYELTVRTKNALIYPAFVVSTFVVVMILLLVMVFPRLASILLETGQEIPIYTKIVIGISTFLVDYGLFLLIVLIIGGFWFWRFAHTERGKVYVSQLKIEIPFFGNLFRKLYLSRIADNMYTMLTSGISLVETLETTASVVGNAVYKDILKEAAQEVRAGSSVSTSFSKHEEIPGILVQMIKIGEETGELGNILKTLSDFYKREVTGTVDTLVGLIEPVLIVSLGLGVGLILTSVLVPIYNIAIGI